MLVLARNIEDTSFNDPRSQFRLDSCSNRSPESVMYLRLSNNSRNAVYNLYNFAKHEFYAMTAAVAKAQTLLGICRYNHS